MDLVGMGIILALVTIVACLWTSMLKSGKWSEEGEQAEGTIFGSVAWHRKVANKE